MLVNEVNRMKLRPTQRLTRSILIIALFFTTAFTLAAIYPVEQEAIETMLMEPLKQPKAPAPAEDKAEVPEKKTPKPLSNRLVEYHIAVKLDAQNKTLEGTQTVTWTNPGKKPVKELYFHLYPNAFSSKKSTFIRESGGKLRGDRMKEDNYGHMVVSAVKTADGEDLAHSMQFVQPDDQNADDQTLMRLKLPQPAGPNEKVTLRMNFAVQLPFAFARMGYVDDFIMAGQWFPKLSVYEPAGRRGRSEEGWNLHQYHGNSEFYSDFGIFNVQITVPAGYTVAATGFPTKPAATQGEMKTYRFYADDVHDFAWAASPQFIYMEEAYSSEHVPGVKIKLYLDPRHKGLEERYFRAAKKALARFSEWYGPYPYSTLSIVVPPQEGGGAGGMEYPTLITAWEASDDDPGLELERVVVHEIGHQYFYGMVASNEFEEAWLDEGFTSYAEDKLMEAEYDVLPKTALEGSYITSPAPLKLYSWHYRSHSQYAENVYTRAKLILLGIEKQIGEQKMNAVLKAYFERWKFKHPATNDFQAVLEKVTKKSWKRYFDQFVYEGMMVDYAVEAIDIAEVSDSDSGKTLYKSKVLIAKRAGEHSQVPILIHFTDGTYVEKMWDGKQKRILYEFTRESPMDWAIIDPQYSIVLENKHINNFMKAKIDQAWNVRWNLGVVKFIETLFGWVAW
jgi:hypothetical protein